MLLAEVFQGFLTAHAKPSSRDGRSVGFCRAESFWRDLCDQSTEDSEGSRTLFLHFPLSVTLYISLQTISWWEEPGLSLSSARAPWQGKTMLALIQALGRSNWGRGQCHSCSPLLPALPQALRHFSSPLWWWATEPVGVYRAGAQGDAPPGRWCQRITSMARSPGALEVKCLCEHIKYSSAMCCPATPDGWSCLHHSAQHDLGHMLFTKFQALLRDVKECSRYSIAMAHDFHAMGLPRWKWLKGQKSHCRWSPKDLILLKDGWSLAQNEVFNPKSALWELPLSSVVSVKARPWRSWSWLLYLSSSGFLISTKLQITSHLDMAQKATACQQWCSVGSFNTGWARFLFSTLVGQSTNMACDRLWSIHRLSSASGVFY